MAKQITIKTALSSEPIKAHHVTDCGKWAVTRQIVGLDEDDIIITNGNADRYSFKRQGELLGRWKLTHVPTGLALPYEFAVLRETKLLADKLCELTKHKEVDPRNTRWIQEAYSKAIAATGPRKAKKGIYRLAKAQPPRKPRNENLQAT